MLVAAHYAPCTMTAIVRTRTTVRTMGTEMPTSLFVVCLRFEPRTMRLVITWALVLLKSKRHIAKEGASFV